ncbi:glutamate--tRNA ligase [bacterium J17]|nr:glutamate--tRNA ligase [bacterium J17]
MSNISPTPRVRFAPSPTGFLHLGGARTALFNYLFAKSQNGKLILRIEDTDRERSTQEAVDAILSSLNWLQLAHDEGPFYQSQRTEIYSKFAKQLLSTGHAYPCYCSAEELEKTRNEQIAAGKKPRYSGKHRPIEPTPQSKQLPSAEDENKFVIRFRMPKEGSTVFKDAILGQISTPNEELDDFIIVRSDGSPTYNFVVVVDDIDMGITHVIRGNDHVSNTPKQVAIYQALGAELPLFAHVPMILGPDKKKLSKRHGATSVIEYKKDGYLPAAFNNYLARLGWSHGDQELFSPEELESCFSLEAIGKSASVFDFDKLAWVNSEHINKTPAKDLAVMVSELLEENDQGFSGKESDPGLLKLIDLLKDRSKTLKDIADGLKWYLAEDTSLEIDEAAKKKHLKAPANEYLIQLAEDLERLEDFSAASIEETINNAAQSLGVKFGKLAQPLRVALTGGTSSPSIAPLLEILGKSSSLARIKRAVQLASKS